MKVDFDNKNRFALIGYPLGHSMSAVIHKELFKISGIDATYTLTEVAPEELENKFNQELKLYKGFNVTIPHKINIIPYLDELSARAKLFGAVNTVDVKGDKIVGHNTDCSGFLRALDMAGITLGGRVLLLGSGGVSRMIAFESILADADLTIAVREDDIPAANIIRQEIKDKLGKDCKIILLSEAEGGYDLVINGTPVGMYPNVDACPVDKKVISESNAAFDVIYNPIETKFTKYAKEAGIKCSSGLSMLVWQAAIAEEIWNNVKFTKDDIKSVIEITEKELVK
ncbi:MAG: shikimate dehydrogenase [Eubacterium sp.]